MSVSSIGGLARISTATPESQSSATSARDTSAVPDGQIDQLTQQPLPPRFPWLSRLSMQLESASKQRASFTPSPPLGDHVDQSA